jgi:ankyrin repeat protein
MDNIIELINNNNFDKAYDILTKKSKLNEYIIDNNNLLHICAIRGKEEIFKLLKDKKVDKYLSNGRGENILHLLFRNGFDKIGLQIAESEPDLLDFTNSQKSYPIINCIDRINTLEKVLDIIISNNFFYQINTLDSHDNNLVSIIISKNNKDYLKIIKSIEKY